MQVFLRFYFSSDFFYDCAYKKICTKITLTCPQIYIDKEKGPSSTLAYLTWWYKSVVFQQYLPIMKQNVTFTLLSSPQWLFDLTDTERMVRGCEMILHYKC